MIKRKLNKFKKLLSKDAEQLLNQAREHKLPLLNLFITLWLVLRVEQLHAVINVLGTIIVNSAIMISVSMDQASAQFAAAVFSILSLFNGQSS